MKIKYKSDENYILSQEDNFILKYTKNNDYKLCGIFNSSSVFNNYFSKYFTNTLELYKFILSNFNSLDNILNINVNEFNITKYKLNNTMSMFIDYHRKYDIFKIIINK